MSDEAWKQRLQSTGNFHSEHLVFRESSVRVVPTVQLHVLLCIFDVFGGLAIWFGLHRYPRLEWVPLIAGCVFVFLGEMMRFGMLFGKKPFLDLEARVFYPEGKRSSALPIGFGEILQLEIVSSIISGSKGREWTGYVLLAVTRAGERYAILASGSEKDIRKDAQKLAQTLFLSLNEWSLDAAPSAIPPNVPNMPQAGQPQPGQPPRQVRPFRPMSPAAKKVSALPGILFGLVFSCIGIGFGCFFVIFPCIKVWQSRTWSTAPAVVISSRLGTSRGSKGGTTYRIEIEYQYQVDGKTWYGKQYDFFSSMHTNVGVKGMREAVNKNPIGANIECLYNPAQPSESVISRKIPGRALLPAVFFLMFSLPGILVIVAFSKSSSKNKEQQMQGEVPPEGGLR